LNLIDVARSAIADIIANPAGYLYSVAMAVLRKNIMTCALPIDPTAPKPAIPCDSKWYGAGAFILAANDIAAGVQTIMDIAENGFFPDFNTDDYCDQIEDIKTELELVIAGTTTEETPETTSTTNSPSSTSSNTTTPTNSS